MFRLQSAFTDFEAHANATLVEKEKDVRMAMYCLLAKEHGVFLGGFGGAKTMLCEMVTQFVSGELFEVLMTKFTAPEELFGLHDFKRMKEGIYRRVSTGKLPEADICLLDECFKSSGAIATTLLRAMASRRWDRGDQVVPIPLWSAFGASNEFPSADDQGAFRDRWLFRTVCKPVASAKGLRRLLWDDGIESKSRQSIPTPISRAGLEEAHAEAMGIEISPEAKDGFLKILTECRKAGISPGDRRVRQSVKAIRAAAWMDASPQVFPVHLEPLENTLWVEATEQPERVAEIVGAVANPEGLKVNTFLLETASVLKDMQEDDLQECVAAVKKLKSIHSSLKRIDGDRAKAAATHVANEIATVNAKVMSSV